MLNPVNYGRYYNDKIFEAETQICLKNYQKAGTILHEILFWLNSGPCGLRNTFIDLHDNEPDDKKTITAYYVQIKTYLDKNGYLTSAVLELGIEQRWL